MTLQERVLAAIPRGGKPGKALYAAMQPTPAPQVDCALLGLLAARQIVRQGLLYRLASDVPEDAEAAVPPPVPEGSQRCYACEEVLPLTRFVLTRKKRPGRICRKCWKAKIGAGTKAALAEAAR